MKKILKFFKAKKYFQKPIKKKYLILDSTQNFIFKKYFKDNEIKILDTRYESINLYILLKTFLSLKFKYNDYIVQYIKEVDCEFVISFIENNIFYYQLKKIFPQKKIILIQNGMRPEFFFDKLENKKNLKVDYLLTFSDFYSLCYKKFIDGKFVSIGSFKSNSIIRDKSEKKESVLFISSGPSSKEDMGIFEKKIFKSNDYFSAEKYLLPLILNYCVEKNLELSILTRSKLDKELEYEKNFYQKIIPSQNFNFLDTNQWEKCYKIIDASTIVVSIYSALGLESISRDNRTAIFNVRDKITRIMSLKLFWSNDKIAKKGSFWTNEITKNEVDRVLNFALTSSYSEWKKSLEIIIPFLVSQDEGNNSFKKILKNENI